MTVLSMIQDAADRIGLPQVSSVIGNSDLTVRTLLQGLIAEGKDLLLEDPPWSTLIREHTFSTQNNVEEYALPSDYQRMINNTAWDRNQFWQIRGGLTPQQWQVIRSGLYQTARLSSNFRIKQATDKKSKAFFLDPVPTSVRTLVFEMQSNGLFYDNAGDPYTGRPAADTSETIFDEEMMTLGIIWRFKMARGFPYLGDREDYQQYRDRTIAQDRAPPTLTVNEMPWRLPIGNIPDTGFGLT